MAVADWRTSSRRSVQAAESAGLVAETLVRNGVAVEVVPVGESEGPDRTQGTAEDTR